MIEILQQKSPATQPKLQSRGMEFLYEKTPNTESKSDDKGSISEVAEENAGFFLPFSQNGLAAAVFGARHWIDRLHAFPSKIDGDCIQGKSAKHCQNCD